MVLIVFSSCVERFEIPKIINSESSDLFGAGDTTYLELKPVWDETYGLEDPSEISIAPDGRIFVSDRLGNSIHVFNQDGSRAQGFELLGNLTNQNGESLYPIDVDIDGKMNVFFIDGSEIIPDYFGYKDLSSEGDHNHKEVPTGYYQFLCIVLSRKVDCGVG